MDNEEEFRFHTKQAVEQIDAALFCGDEFTHFAARVALRRMMLRWRTRLSELTDADLIAHGMPREGDDAHGDDADGLGGTAP